MIVGRYVGISVRPQLRRVVNTVVRQRDQIGLGGGVGRIRPDNLLEAENLSLVPIVRLVVGTVALLVEYLLRGLT